MANLIGKQFIHTFTMLCLMTFCHSAEQQRAPHIFIEGFSDSFIIRWAFQEMCDHFYDPNTIECAWPTKPQGITLNPLDIEEGDCIFVRNAVQFFKEIHSSIQKPYIIISHGDYRDTCNEELFHYLDDPKIIAWLSIHPFKRAHKKFHPLPLGINQEPEYFAQKASLDLFFRNLREQTSKTKLLCLNFAAEKNPERQKILDLFADKPWCCNNEIQPFIEYMREMASSKFVLSPRGWGPDSYRTWEALLVGTIPIVKKGEWGINKNESRHVHRPQEIILSQLDTLYIDLPILIINDWQEITEQFLQEKYKEITSRMYNLDKLYKKYWLNKLNHIRNAYFQEHMSGISILNQLRTGPLSS